MDILESILDQKGGDFVSNLIGRADFSAQEAERFVPAAGSSVVSAFTARAGDLDVSDVASAGNVLKIMEGVDVSRLAGDVGITREKASAGLATFLPMLLGFIGDKHDQAGGLTGILGSLGGLDDAVDKLKGLGKLLG